ncbi:MAG: hypothetical protein ACLGHP_07460, partial [Vicinamibacteria bacterium]
VTASLWPLGEESAWEWRRLVAVMTRTHTEGHLFGLVVATLGAWRLTSRLPRLGRGTVTALTTAAVAAPLGLVDADTLTGWALAWWLAWFALGVRVLWQYAATHRSLVGRALLLVSLVAVPWLRHAERMPGPLVHEAPALRLAAAGGGSDALAVADDMRTARLVRHVGLPLLPGTTDVVSACLQADAPVRLVGTPERHAARFATRARPGDTHGLALQPATSTVDADALAASLRDGAVVAYALAAGAGRWLPPGAVTGVTFGLPDGAARVRHALVGIGTMPLAADEVRQARSGTQQEQVATIDGRPLRWPLGAKAEDGLALLTRAAQPVASSDVAAVVVFDRAERPVVSAIGEAAPRLPLTVQTTDPALQALLPFRVDGASLARWRGDDLLPRTRPRAPEARTLHVVPVRAGDGWHEAELMGDGSFRWSAERGATALFLLPRQTAVTLHVDAQPARTPAHGNALTLRLNGDVIAEALDGAASLAVEAGRTRPGLNVLTFEVRATLPPGSQPGDARALGAQVRDLLVQVPR